MLEDLKVSRLCLSVVRLLVLLVVQLSHRRHHLHHNHVDHDYSHPWYTPERLKNPEEGLARWMDGHAWVRFMFPCIGWQLYLYGLPDGSHYLPWPNQRLWKECSDNREAVKCVVSLVVVLANAAGVYLAFNGDLRDIAFYYVMPLLVFGWWIVTVTYLQHHSPHTLVYDDTDWSFVKAAFETVDRTYGFGIDHLSHHITDGHVVHHLFFTKIPHYHLPLATSALRKYLLENGVEQFYKHESTRDFVSRVHTYFVKYGFASKLARADLKQKDS